MYAGGAGPSCKDGPMIPAGNVQHFACLGVMLPWRADGTCRTCGKRIVAHGTGRGK